MHEDSQERPGDDPKTSYATRGPHPVGLKELSFPSAARPGRLLPTSVWYPAAHDPARPPSGTGKEAAPHLLGQAHRATLDLPVLETASPLILFSHGNSGSRHQSTFLTTHLASWGFVVAAPDHVGNTFFDAAERVEPEAIRDAHLEARASRPLDLLGVLQDLMGTPERPAPRNVELPPILPQRLGALGHSFGGWTTLKLARLDSRLRALCCLAPVSEPFVGRRAFEPGELPLAESVETLVLAAKNDVLVDLETSILPLHERLGHAARLETLEGLDHFHFCDGIALLHKMHFNAPRPGQSRPTLPYEALRSEAETHVLLNQKVTGFFVEAFEQNTNRARTGSPGE